MSYVPLFVKSNFSFLEGASHPAELVEQAHALGLPAIAITDRDGVYGVVQAHMRAKELGIKLLIGAEVTLTSAHTVVLIAENRAGYGNLCKLLSQGRLRSAKGSSSVSLEEVCDAAPGLLALVHDPEILRALAPAFTHSLYAACARHLRPEEEAAEVLLREQARALSIPTVAVNEVLYHVASRRKLQDVLTCIRHGVTLPTAGTLLKPNAEHDVKSADAMASLFADDLDALARTRELAARCTFSMGELRYVYPAERVPKGVTVHNHLRNEAFAGALERYPQGIPEAVQKQMESELAVIHTLDYGGYFLTMHEIVKFCRAENILCQGRGSAANSVVCYALGITAIDPTRFDLLFERFLSLERAEPPDIDLDIEHNRREEVIQEMYRRYNKNGQRHAAMVANVIRYRTRSAIRDVGKALGIPLTALNRLSKVLGRFSDLDDETLRFAGLDPSAPVHQHLLALLNDIQQVPRHLSIHPGGFLLGHDPVDTLVPIEPATMPDRTVIQWDKYAVEDLGLFKVDLLGLGALTQVRECFELIEKSGGPRLSIEGLSAEDDEETYDMICRAETIGVFQIESRAQMSMLPRLKPRKFYDLVIEVAIVRPGPIQGDMVHPFLQRRANPDQKPDYPHPLLERVLEKTLGVPIFQEQVMKIAVLVGGYTGGEADQLRRDMAAWQSTGRIDLHKDKLISRMIGNGVPPDFAARIFSQIEGFGEYGFPESHAASFALIAYVTAYLRCHYPAAFTCSLLNAQPMGFYSPATLVEDAKRQGVVVHPIDINASQWDCSLETHAGQPAVRMGLRYVKGLTTRDQGALAAKPGPYASIEELARKTGAQEHSLVALAEAGALDSLVPDRRRALWEAREIATRMHDRLELSSAKSTTRFKTLSRPEQVFWDYRVSAHSTRGHPLLHLRDTLQRQGIPTAAEVSQLEDGARAEYVGMTICRQHPGTAAGVTFYTLEDETGFVNLVVWKRIFERYSVIAQTALLMGVSGVIQKESGVLHLVAEKLWEPELDFTPEGTTTRSFQ